MLRVHRWLSALGSGVRNVHTRPCEVGSQTFPVFFAAKLSSSSGPKFGSLEFLLAVSFASTVGAALANSQKAQKPVSCEGRSREVELGFVEEFEEGELYEVRVGEEGGDGDDSTVLVAKVKGKFFCTGAYCTHYSAPLALGTCSKYRVISPWNNCEYDVRTGKCVGGPALDDLPTFPVKVKDGRVLASIPLTLPSRARPSFAKRDKNNKTTFCIVGGGAGALAAVETLRSEGFTGRIVVLSKDASLPYDRPVLSKNLNANPERILLRPPSHFEDLGVEFRLNSEVASVDPKEKRVTCKDGTSVAYDKALIATGSTPRSPPELPGSELKNVFTMRSLDDVKRIKEAIHRDTRVVVIGSSFLGVETASALVKSVTPHVTLLSAEAEPFQKVFGPKIGKLMKRFLRKKGVTFVGGVNVRDIRGDEGKVHSVEVDNEIYQADVVILATGATPNTGIVRGVEGALEEDGGIRTDAFLQVDGCPDLFAAGDVASFPYFRTGERARVEHWNAAMQQGRVAARNMLGRKQAYREIPFFTTLLFNRTLRYTGHAPQFDDLIVEGDMERLEFLAYFVEKGRVEAVLSMGRDPLASVMGCALKHDLMPDAVQLRMGSANSEAICDRVRVRSLSRIPDKTEQERPMVSRA
uniref:Rieske domain-containing protein n=1 Tax=Chromera velia CCMP2878 TaxID=1169474 RepID=A0A0G4FSY8_9ALVE|eukprot:Cvel_3717.t1-p1 / transcript=Cvel_3717.t1 / gene=Cvel_3717 / organism=Chromera_velia_CCMP2878 / gene_product=Apoptosis-inducing factor 3, putative / transcript_product=Apoptosis-inducing factor 3, putative / location=Cvel_scaffold154:105694-107604(-) / protein_length=637 / sequence_SO=supercontig / SO=protein_coding / is_pseudo=false